MYSTYGLGKGQEKECSLTATKHSFPTTDIGTGESHRTKIFYPECFDEQGQDIDGDTCAYYR